MKCKYCNGEDFVLVGRDIVEDFLSKTKTVFEDLQCVKCGAINFAKKKSDNERESPFSVDKH